MNDSADNITLCLATAAASAPDRPAIIFGRRSVRYSQLDEAVDQAAAFFVGNGVSPGDVVPLLLTDQLGLAVALLGAMRMGATAMPLSPGLTDSQRRDLIREAGAGILVVGDRAPPEADIRLIRFSLTRLPEGSHRHLMVARPDHPCEIIVGSGSTGQPLLLPINHTTMRARTTTMAQGFGLRPGDRFMLATQMYFAVAIVWFLATVTHGVTCIFRDGKAGYKPVIERCRPDYLHLTVLHAHQLLAEAEAHPDFDLSGLKQLSVGASTVSEALRKALKDRFKTRLAVNFGTNETATVSIAYDEDIATLPGTVGRPLPHAVIEIVDGDDKPLGPGEVGEMRIRGSGNIDGYVGGAAPERFRDGWFYSRDLAKWQDGQIVYCGRADQMMIMDGINIYPAEIERALDRHPAIGESAAFPLPHPVHGQIPVCAVALKVGFQLSQGELMEFAKRALGLKHPRRLFILNSLPRNPQGKLIRAELAKRLMAAAEKERSE